MKKSSQKQDCQAGSVRWEEPSVISCGLGRWCCTLWAASDGHRVNRAAAAAGGLEGGGMSVQKLLRASELGQWESGLELPQVQGGGCKRKCY